MSLPSRKPYLTLKSSIAELFKAETRYLKASNQKESVFEKPYFDLEYQTMHLKIPRPDWPTWYLPPWKLGKWRTFPDVGGGALPTYKCPGCMLYADPTYDCEKDPVEIHAARWCTDTPWTGTDRLFERKGVPQGSKVAPGTFVGGVSAGDTALRVYAEKGSIRSFTIGAWAYIGPSIAAFVDPAISEHRICGLMIDGAGSMCIACADVKYCSCENPSVAFSIASYDSTIDPGGSAYVTVTGGCGPYSYSVSGTGYSASGTGTVGTISSASGTCGVEYAVYVTVTAKDFCGTEKTCVIRNTGGKWTISVAPFVRCFNLPGGGRCVSCFHTSCAGNCTGPQLITQVDNLTKWAITGYSCNCCNYGCSANCWESCLEWCPEGTETPPQCTPPGVCDQGVDVCLNFSTCAPDTVEKCVWACSGSNCNY